MSKMVFSEGFGYSRKTWDCAASDIMGGDVCKTTGLTVQEMGERITGWKEVCTREQQDVETTVSVVSAVLYLQNCNDLCVCRIERNWPRRRI